MHLVRSNWDCYARNHWQSPRYCFWLIDELKCASCCWGHRHITWYSDFNFAPTIGYEKAIRQDGCRVCSLWIISTGSHVPGIDGQIQRIPLRIAFPSSIFVRFIVAPCEYSLFPNLKKWFGGKRFTTQRAAHRRNRGLHLFERLNKSYYSGLKKLENHWINAKSS